MRSDRPRTSSPKRLDPDALTPKEALEALYRLKGFAKKEK
jgi:hypothetical protein